MNELMQRWYGKLAAGVFLLPVGYMIFQTHDRWVGGQKKWLMIIGGGAGMLIGAAGIVGGIVQKARGGDQPA